MPDALIFDIDGTLLDSVDLHTFAWQEAFDRFGHQIPFADVRSQIGKGGDQLLPVFLSEEEVKREGKQLEEFRSKLFKEKYLPEVKPFPRVRDLFQKALASGQKLALASSARGDELEHYERLANVEDLVHVETSSADAGKSKPHPDIFEAALARLPGIPKERVLVIGDSPYDAEAALRAGVACVGVRCGGFPEADLRAAGCIDIFKDPADLLARYDGSPLARKRTYRASS